MASDLNLPTLTTAEQKGWVSCSHCSTVWDGAPNGEKCLKCGASLYSRKVNSISRTWALLIAACIMYIPANIYPVMLTQSFLGTQYDTILSGIIYFWISGSWGLAAIIFIASFLVPLFKLIALAVLLITVQRKNQTNQRQHTYLYHLIEFIGRWSMLDVFVVSILAGLVQIKGLAQITAGFGITAFASVVVLTMLAALSFDVRLIWR